MKPPIIVNECDSIDTTGPFYVFKTVSALEAYLEPWYVDEPHFIFDSDGMQLEITAEGRRVRLAPKEPRVFNPEIARKYFAAFLGVSNDRAERATLSELAEESVKFADG